MPADAVMRLLHVADRRALGGVRKVTQTILGILNHAIVTWSR
jgi:hypothetical protein